jgi:predicted DsbA family dithiol-disulfide isomerase
MDSVGPLSVDIWSDVVCPWCYLGKRRFELALAAFPHRDEVAVTWHSFELDPQAPRERGLPAAEHLAAKYGIGVEQARASQARLTELGAEVSLTYDFDGTRGGNTFDAHRAIHLAASHGLQGAATERLMRGYFAEGEPIGDPEAVVRIVAEVGVDAEEARAALAGAANAAAVRADEELARRLGITGVPFFVLGRRYGVSGAQPPELLLQALERAWSEHAAGAAA